jgi:hypothetical protein
MDSRPDVSIVHHFNPMEGFWRAMKDAIGAGRCLSDLHQLYQRAHGAAGAAHLQVPLVTLSASNLEGLLMARYIAIHDLMIQHCFLVALWGFHHDPTRL